MFCETWSIVIAVSLANILSEGHKSTKLQLGQWQIKQLVKTNSKSVSVNYPYGKLWENTYKIVKLKFIMLVFTVVERTGKR